MFTIRHPTDADRIGGPSIRSLVHQHFAEILDGEPCDPGIHGEMIVVETGDTAAAMEEQSGCSTPAGRVGAVTSVKLRAGEKNGAV